MRACPRAASRAAKIHPLQERAKASDADTEALLVVHVRFDELTAECSSLTTGSEHGRTDYNALADNICELKAYVPTNNKDWVVFV